MEVDTGAKLHELKVLMKACRDSNHNVSSVASKLDELGIDHIPVIALRSGKQLRDLKLDYVTNSINNLRAGIRFQPAKINLAERILESTKKIKKTNIYLMKVNSVSLNISPLNYQQLISYLKYEINYLQS